MKRAEWTRSFWVKASAFTLAVLLVPFGCLCGASLLAAYEFGWWTGGNEFYARYLIWVEDKFWTRRGTALLYALHNMAIPLLIATVVLFLLALAYLARAAGRQSGTDELVPLWQEKIPLDLYAAADVFLFAGIASLGIDATYAWDEEPLIMTLFLLGDVTVAAVLALAAWMTLCVRIKQGCLWRSTLVFRVLRLCWHAAKWGVRMLFAAVRAVPLVWRTVLGAGAFCLAAMLLAVTESYVLLLLLLGVLFFFACALSLQLRRLQAGGEALAAGDLDAKVDTAHLLWDFKRHGEDLNCISRGMQRAVDQQLKSERLKTELITNVSHDIKTPLTSIINYVGLLRRDPKGEQAGEYLEVLDRQSRRLKKLTEDLVEVSKASTGNVAVNASRRSVNELLLQALGEYSERLERAQLEAVLTLPEHELTAWADGTLLWRVVDNVLSNACKYALPGTRFYVDAAESGERVKLSFKNISRDRLNIPAEELMERFVRGDASRGGEGSGLGLNIARSLTELQGGTLDLNVDGDLFRVDITLPAAA